jgi:hypothetical protein
MEIIVNFSNFFYFGFDLLMEFNSRVFIFSFYLFYCILCIYYFYFFILFYFITFRPIYYGATGGILSGFSSVFGIQGLLKIMRRTPMGNAMKFGTFVVGAMFGWSNVSRYFYIRAL